MIYSIDVRIEAPVNDTEVTDRVHDAVANLFPNAELESQPGKLVGETHTLDPFSDLLHEQEILDTARKQFLGSARGGGFDFRLKKQAAFQGVINFAVGNPDELGDIEVEVVVREPSVEEFVDYVAPPTQEGKPVAPDRGEGERR